MNGIICPFVAHYQGTVHIVDTSLVGCIISILFLEWSSLGHTISLNRKWLHIDLLSKRLWVSSGFMTISFNAWSQHCPCDDPFNLVFLGCTNHLQLWNKPLITSFMQLQQWYTSLKFTKAMFHHYHNILMSFSQFPQSSKVLGITWFKLMLIKTSRQSDLFSCMIHKFI